MLGDETPDAYEKARTTIANFIGARQEEVVFTRNTTEGINLVARSLRLKRDDAVLTSDKEHNSNLLPWLLARERGIHHVVVPSADDNTFDMTSFEAMLKKKEPALVALVFTSNLDGVTIPAKEIVKTCHDHNALVLLDAAQTVPHQPVDVHKLGVDFLAFSGHKMLGPTGTGALFVRKDLFESLSPFMLGGETVDDSTYSGFTLRKPPQRYEAGLQDYAGISGFARAARYLQDIGFDRIQRHERTLTKLIADGIEAIPGLRIIGPDAEQRGSITSFIVDGMNHHDIALLLSKSYAVMVRSGRHCVHSWFNSRHIDGSCRVSLYLYNTEEECAAFIDALHAIAKMR